MKGLIEFAKQGNSNKIVLMVNIFDLIVLIFMDYIFGINMGIDIKSMFLTSFDLFVLNIFTIEFFTLIIGFGFLFFLYYLVVPILFPIFFYRIMAIIYGIITISILWLPNQIYCLFKTKKWVWVTIDDSILSQLKWYKMIREDNEGNIFPDERIDLFLEIQSGKGRIEDFYVNLFRIMSSISLVLIVFNSPFYAVIPFLLFSLISLIFASALFNFHLNSIDLQKIVIKLKPNLTTEQLNILAE